MDLQKRISESEFTRKLNLKNMGLFELPELPENLLELYCDGNYLTSLPKLPYMLVVLNCDDNQLKFLPTLPDSLTELRCNYNELLTLPLLPNNLIELYCSFNQLTKLTTLQTLPNTLRWLYCNDNYLTTLPTLPRTLDYLYCRNNQLTTLPILPDTLVTLDYYGNPFNKIFSSLIKKINIFNTIKTTIKNIREYYRTIEFRINAKNTIPLQIALYKVTSCDIPIDCFSLIGSYLSGENGTLSTQISKLRSKLH